MLAWLVRDEKVMTLEDAHFKLSYMPAHCGGFKDRGVIREGAPADILVYDLDKLEVLPSEIRSMTTQSASTKHFSALAMSPWSGYGNREPA